MTLTARSPGTTAPQTADAHHALGSSRTNSSRRPSVVRISRRSVIALMLTSAVGLAAFGWPFLAGSESAIVAHSNDTPWLFAVLLPLVLAVVMTEVADGGLDSKSVALLGVLSAAAAAMRPFGSGHAGFEPMWIVVVLGGRALGPGFGFCLGSIGMFSSALVTGGVGPWLPFQMIAAAWVGLGAGLLPRARGRGEIALIAGYSAIACVAYGFAMNLWFWPLLATGDGFAPGMAFVAGAPVAQNLHHWLLFCLSTSLGFDLPRAALTVTLVIVAGPAVLVALRRASRRAAFDAPVVFDTHTS